MNQAIAIEHRNEIATFSPQATEPSTSLRYGGERKDIPTNRVVSASFLRLASASAGSPFYWMKRKAGATAFPFFPAVLDRGILTREPRPDLPRELEAPGRPLSSPTATERTITMKRIALPWFLLLGLAAAATAQVTRLAPPNNTSGFVYPNPGELAVVPNWIVDVDEAGRYEASRPHCIVVDEPGEYLLSAAVQWSLQSISPFTGNEPQMGSRYVSLWRLPEGGTPEKVGEGIVAPVQDFVTKHSVTAQATLEVGDCVFVGVAQTASAPIAVVGTSFWLTPAVENEAMTFLEWWRSRQLARRASR